MNQQHTETPLPVVKGVRRILYWVLALSFFLLAMVGVALPGIPTTPFLLLMGYFLIRVSPRLNAWVLSWPIVGRPVREWQDKGGVRPGVKVVAYLMVTLLVGISLLLADLHWIIRCVVFVAALLGIYVVYRLPTIRD